MHSWLRPWLLALALCGFAAQAESGLQSLKIISRENYASARLMLGDEEWRWLGEKQSIAVAVWRPSIPPLVMFTEERGYEGITADYVQLVTHTLGLRARVVEYADRAGALAALKNHAVDLVVDPAGAALPQHGPLTLSERLIGDNPVLVHARQTGAAPFVYKAGMRLAISRWYADNTWLEAQFPQARVMYFDSDDAALASVAFGENDFYVGSLIAATYLIDRNYTQYLEVLEVFPDRDTGSRFILRNDQPVLLRAVNRALAVIPDPQHQIILQQWGERADLWRVRKKIAFSSRERKWLATNPTVKLSVNALYAPFTMIDAGDGFYGVTADVLRLIRLRTGIRFQAVPANSVDEMQRQVKHHDTAFIGAISESATRSKDLLFSRPYFSSPFVLVMKTAEKTTRRLAAGERVALVEGNALREELQAQFPGIEIVEAPNASLAMQWVDEGKVDAMVHTLFGASYMLDRYFKGRLTIAGRIGKEMAGIRFAVGRDQPELLSILNKSLESISPNKIAGITGKWQMRPDVQLNTWALYRTQFWLVGGGAAAIVLTSLMWIFYLRREVAARQQAQTSLQSQLKFNETLINSVSVPVYVIDRYGTLVLHNYAWRDFFFHAPCGDSARPLGHPESPLYEVWKEVMPLLAGKNQQNGAVRVFTLSNGETARTVIHHAVPYANPQGQMEGLICSWMDITEHEALTQALSEERERAEQANRAKSTFLATMSHEIRTPVSAIIGLLELAVKTSGNGDDREDPVRVAWESSRSLMGLIGDILDMARIESGRLELAPEWVHVGELLPPVVRVFEGLARQKGLRLRCSMPAALPHQVFIDPQRVRQVISNLVGNAVKFTDTGGVDISLDFTPVLHDERVQLTISVQDSGRGISDEDQRDIFAPWVQAKNADAQSGSGLGLGICAQLVRMMGGEISLDSRLGQGSKVTFVIPVEQRMDSPQPQPAAEPLAGKPQVALHILAVDDHPANRLLLKRQLTHLGHQVTEAKDGEEGWALWQQQEHQLVITDCSMPGMDGLALTRLIRQHQSRPTVIMGLTANAWPEERLRCREAGMDDCLFKPLQLPQLQALLAVAASDLHPPLPEKETMKLETLINYESLFSLAHNDIGMVRELLRATLVTNRQDLRLAQDLLVQEKWPTLVQCIHRITGAAQIIGAQRAARSSAELEALCRAPQVDRAEIHPYWQEFDQSVAELNLAIDAWLVANPEGA
ncbi:MAG TPA: histidine kinase [Serratia grimesii]|uniref:histidine kinase n=1 Tax=Serratia grimesii TaxID=82995 RepID=A0A9C7QWC3_9GAMM|nr:transporter substrate-binding domain-containing protein [Serratia grimesii]HCK00054.1 histidine kinase [Serratia grimesii]